MGEVSAASAIEPSGAKCGRRWYTVEIRHLKEEETKFELVLRIVHVTSTWADRNEDFVFAIDTQHLPACKKKKTQQHINHDRRKVERQTTQTPQHRTLLVVNQLVTRHTFAPDANRTDRHTDCGGLRLAVAMCYFFVGLLVFNFIYILLLSRVWWTPLDLSHPYFSSCSLVFSGSVFFPFWFCCM